MGPGRSPYLRGVNNSRWRAGLWAHLGLIYRRSGQFQPSLEAFENAWALKQQQTGRNAAAIANWSVGELLDLHRHMGHMESLHALLSELRGRKLYGPTTEKWRAARAWLAHRTSSEHEAICGLMAVTHLLEHDGHKVSPAMLAAQASHDGMSLQPVQSLARQSGLKLQAVKRPTGAIIPVPAVMHWKRAHYSAILKRQERQGQPWYLIENPLATEAMWIRQAVLDSQTSGYFLIPEGDLPTGW